MYNLIIERLLTNMYNIEYGHYYVLDL